jgi:hypothetical protein
LAFEPIAPRSQASWRGKNHAASVFGHPGSVRFQNAQSRVIGHNSLWTNQLGVGCHFGNWVRFRENGLRRSRWLRSAKSGHRWSRWLRSAKTLRRDRSRVWVFGAWHHPADRSEPPRTQNRHQRKTLYDLRMWKLGSFRKNAEALLVPGFALRSYESFHRFQGASQRLRTVKAQRPMLNMTYELEGSKSKTKRAWSAGSRKHSQTKEGIRDGGWDPRRADPRRWQRC